MNDLVPRDAVVFTGRISTFGGPKDLGVAPHEGLALINPSEIEKYPNLFLLAQPAGTSGLARRLDPNAFYVACRWDYGKTPREKLKATKVLVTNPKTGAEARRSQSHGDRIPPRAGSPTFQTVWQQNWALRPIRFAR